MECAGVTHRFTVVLRGYGTEAALLHMDLTSRSFILINSYFVSSAKIPMKQMVMNEQNITITIRFTVVLMKYLEWNFVTWSKGCSADNSCFEKCVP